MTCGPLGLRSALLLRPPLLHQVGDGMEWVILGEKLVAAVARVHEDGRVEVWPSSLVVPDYFSPAAHTKLAASLGSPEPL